MNKRFLVILLSFVSLASFGKAQSDSLATDSIGTIVDEVIWVVGDEAILKSDVEAMRIQGQQEGLRWKGDPDCAIPEQIAVQKLYLNQAIIDSVEVTEAEITQGVEQYIENMISVIGSREKLEEYQKKTLSQIRAELRDSYRERLMVQGMQQKLVKDITVTPAEVRRYFKDMSLDSIPFVPTEVEVQIISLQPRVEQEEINRVKEELREYTDRINRGETSFQTLARLYSEDGSARNGGELGYSSRAQWVPEFANVETMILPGLANYEITLGEDEYFVLGDSRNNSEDSRYATIGNVKKSDIIGRAWIRTNKFGFINSLNKKSDE